MMTDTFMLEYMVYRRERRLASRNTRLAVLHELLLSTGVPSGGSPMAPRHLDGGEPSCRHVSFEES